MVTAFLEDRMIACGERKAVVRLIETRFAAQRAEIRLFDDESGGAIDLDYREPVPEAVPPKGRGRPKLGVVAREVTLLPHHWDWLAAQRGGASAALRRLVDQASKAPPSPDLRRDAAYRFMSDHCGDRPGYEEALRALHRGDKARLQTLTRDWPADVRAYIRRLLAQPQPAART